VSKTNRIFLSLFFGLVPFTASALELNWSGQFRTEVQLIQNYTMDAASGSSINAAKNSTGYYVQPAGSNNASLKSMYLRLKPSLIVNDNVYIKSEWWLGDPVYGFYGNATPNTPDQLYFDSTYSRGSPITAQRVWAEILSDVGTVQLGRAPLHWGLGVMWNDGSKIWDRYMSTGDVIRLISKFGSFSFIPSYIGYSAGNTQGGSCTIATAGGACTAGGGDGTVSDYSIILKYENLDEDFEGGVNFVKRIGGSDQGFYTGPVPGVGTNPSLNYNIWDLFAKKKFGKFSIAGEVPIASGKVGGIDYTAYALAIEGNYKPNESWEGFVRAGRSPGQPNDTSSTPSSLKSFYFNPNYHIATIMFNYQLRNFSAQQTLNSPLATNARMASPYDNPIVNATYVNVGGTYRAEKWSLNLGLTYAKADTSAAAGSFFFNSWTRQMSAAAANGTQGTNLGFETDVGATYYWDDNFLFKLDLGFFFPGDYYKFSNAATLVENASDMVWASIFRVGVSF
jgi:hypothetical protein